MQSPIILVPMPSAFLALKLGPAVSVGPDEPKLNIHAWDFTRRNLSATTRGR